MNQKILMITRKFPPASGGGTPRMANFASQLKRHNFDPTIITPSVPDGWVDREKEKTVSDLDIIRVGEMSRKKRHLTKKIVGRMMPIDPLFLWSLQVIKAIKRLDMSQHKLVFTSGPPHSVHYAGYKISQKYNLPWIADFRDQYTLAPEYRAYGPVHKKLDTLFEKLIYEHANFVITNTRINRRDVLKTFPNVKAQKFVTINNGFDKDELKQGTIEPPWCVRNSSTTNYVYLGGLRGHQIDKCFFEGFDLAAKNNPKLFKNIKLRIVGDLRHASPAVKQLINDGLITEHAPVPAKDIGTILQHADAGICWQRNDSRYRGTIPQKFFEYFGARKPVFFVGRTDGEIGRICSRYHIGVAADPISANQVADSFIRFHKSLRNHQLNYENCPARLFDQFNRTNQAKKLAEIFIQACSS